MFHLSRLSWAGLWLAAFLILALDARGATVVAGPGDAGLRAAIATAQSGDTVILSNSVLLQSPLRLDKRLTLQVPANEAYRIWLEGNFEGELLHVAAGGVVLEWVRLIGSPRTDGLFIEMNVVLRDGSIENCRKPVVSDLWTTVRLERVQVTFNREGLECANLEAKDSTFSFNGGYVGGGGWNATLEGCIFENNQGDGLILTYGSAKHCTFRYNGGFGLRFDPDPGALWLDGCLFYANTGGGLLLREEAIATVDNCTFTRHTGLPAVIVTEAHDVLFRHCTVTDNVVVDPGSSPWFPSQGAFALGFNGRVELQNCLVADNPTNNSPFASGLDGSWIDGGGNVIGGPAKLGTLRNNGGNTLTLAPLPGSPAIDAGIPSALVFDGRGLSRLAGAAPDAGGIETDATPLADEDKDGLPDIWERFHSLNPADATDAISDVDADGQNALAEYHSHTDPTDAKSVHRLDEIILEVASIFQPFPRYGYLVWNIYPGVTYEVETSTDLRQWHKIPTPFYLAGIRNGRQTMSVGIQADEAMSFYRVAVKDNIFD